MTDFLGKKTYVLDGATGTRLQELGMPAGCCVPDWILKNPDAIRSVKKSYLDAGSDLLYAPTFGAIAPTLKKHRIKTSVRDMNKALVELAKEEAGGRPVGGDIAPTGLQLHPVGDTGFDELVSIFQEQADALEEAGVDFFAIETQMSLAECRAAVIAVRSVSDKPILTSFSCTNTGRSLYGEDMGAALMCLQDMGVQAFGINCCDNFGLVARMLNKLRPHSTIPLLAKPNAGSPVSKNGRLVYRMTANKMAAYVPRFVASGARLIGGCCGTDASFIEAIRSCLDSMELTDFIPAESRAVAASAFRVIELTPRMKIEEIDIDDNIVENASVAEAVGTKLLKVHIRDDMDLDTLEEAQIALRLPLAVECDDEELLRRFLRFYNGKPVIL